MDTDMTVRILDQNVYTRLMQKAKKYGTSPDELVFDALRFTLGLDKVSDTLYYTVGGDDMSIGTPRITLRLEKEWRDKLEDIATANGATLTDVVRKAIEEYIWSHSND